MVIFQKLSKIDRSLLWNTVRKLAMLIMLPHSDPLPDILISNTKYWQLPYGLTPVASQLITGGRFPQILDLSRGLKIGSSSSGCLRETSDFSNNNDRRRYFVVAAQIYSILLILFRRRTIFEMSALEELAQKFPFSAGGGGLSDRSNPPLPTGLGLLFNCGIRPHLLSTK